MSPHEPNFLELFAIIQLFIYKWKEATPQEHVAAIHAYNTIIATIYGPERGSCTVGPVKLLPEPKINT